MTATSERRRQAALSLMFCAAVTALWPAAARAGERCHVLLNSTDPDRQAAYDRCVTDWYGRSNPRSSSPQVLKYWWSAPREEAPAVDPEANFRRLREQAAALYSPFDYNAYARQKDATGRAQGRVLAARADALARVQALLDRMGARGPQEPADYDALLANAWPEADLLRHYAAEASTRLGGRFTVLRHLVDMAGCPAITRHDLVGSQDTLQVWRACGSDGAITALRAATARLGDLPVTDRALLCGLEIRLREQSQNIAWARDDMVAACRSALPAAVRDAAVAAWDPAQLSRSDVDRPWLVFFHARRGSVDPADAAALRRLVEEARMRERLLLAAADPAAARELREVAARQGMDLDWAPVLPVPEGPGEATRRVLAGEPPLPAAARALLLPGQAGQWGAAWEELQEAADAEAARGNSGRALRLMDTGLALMQALAPADGRNSLSLVGMARVQEALGRVDEAGRLLEVALARRSAAGDSGSEALKTVLLAHAQFLARRDRLGEVELLYVRLSRIEAARPDGAKSPEYLAALVRQARLQLLTGNVAGAREAMEQALANVEARDAGDAPDGLEVRELGAEVLFRAGEADAGARLLREALAMRRLSLWPQDPAVVAAHERAVALARQHGQGALAQALETELEAVRAQARVAQAGQRERAAGMASPRQALRGYRALFKDASSVSEPVLLAMRELALAVGARDDARAADTRLAALYLDQGRPAEAERLLRTLLAEDKAALANAAPGDKPRLALPVAQRWELLAAAHARQGRRKEQQEALFSHYNALLTARGKDHPDAARALLRYAAVRFEHGEEADAVTFLLLVLDRPLPPAEPGPMQAVHAEARDYLLRAARRLDYGQARALLEKGVLPPRWVWGWEAMLAEARAPADNDYLRESRIDSARQALETATRQAGKERGYVAWSELALARALLAGGDDEARVEADALLASAQSAAREAGDVEAEIAVAQAAAAHWSAGDAAARERAVPLRERAARLQEKRYGRGDDRAAGDWFALVDLHLAAGRFREALAACAEGARVSDARFAPVSRQGTVQYFILQRKLAAAGATAQAAEAAAIHARREKAAQKEAAREEQEAARAAAAQRQAEAEAAERRRRAEEAVRREREARERELARASEAAEEARFREFRQRWRAYMKAHGN